MRTCRYFSWKNITNLSRFFVWLHRHGFKWVRFTKTIAWRRVADLSLKFSFKYFFPTKTNLIMVGALKIHKITNVRWLRLTLKKSKYMFRVTNTSTGSICRMFFWMCSKATLRKPEKCHQACIYAKSKIRGTWKRCELYSKLTINSP